MKKINVINHETLETFSCSCGEREETSEAETSSEEFKNKKTPVRSGIASYDRKCNENRSTHREVHVTEYE